MTADEYYEQRDDRTLHCAKTPAYQTRTCVMSVDNATAATHAGQVMAIAAADLIARWCRTVHIEVVDAPLVPQLRWMGASLRRTIEHRMRAVDPFGAFTFDASATTGDLRLVIGRSECRAAPGQTIIDAAGWVAMVGRTSPIASTAHPAHPAAGLCAAALGVAQVFRDAIDRYTPFGDRILLDVLTLAGIDSLEAASTAPWPEPQYLGRILCVGAGAVASSTLYAMALLALRADVTCVDKDSLKVLNLSRSPTAVLAAVSETKVEALGRALAGSPANIQPRPMWWREYSETAEFGEGQFDIWLPLANERGVRADMQAAAPPLMVHGSTSGNWTACFGRHIAGRDDCLVERFPGQTAAVLACATTSIEVEPEVRVDAALPFLSLMAGALVALDLLRSSMPGYPQVANLAVFDFGANPMAPMVLSRRSRPGCPYCGAGVAVTVRRNTRYGHLLSAAL